MKGNGVLSRSADAKIREGGCAEDIFDFSVPIEICTPGGGCSIYTFNGWVGITSTDLVEELNIHDFTSFDGRIDKLAKSMSYTSGKSL